MLHHVENDLIQAYIEYFKTGSYQNLLQNLFASNSFLGLRLLSRYDLSNKSKQRIRTLHSSGTSTLSTEYEFSPVEVMGPIEAYNKLQNEYRYVVRIMHNIFRPNKSPYFTTFRQDGFLRDIMFAYSHIDESVLGRLCDEIASLNQGSCAISASPHFFLYSNGITAFQDFVIKNKITLISTDYSAFFKKSVLRKHGVHVNDCMINWKDGLNFHHCKYGNAHILPIFAPVSGGFINLLNLLHDDKNHEATDDFFTFRHTSDACACGLPIAAYNFIPHKKYAISVDNRYYHDLNLAESLTGNYVNLQFIQNGATIDCLYLCNHMPDSDKTVIQQFFDPMPIKYHMGRFLTTSTNKYEFFYNNIRNLPYGEFNQSWWYN